MELTKNDYKYIQTKLDKETKEIFQNIWKKYGKYIKGKEKLKVIEDRINSINETRGIVIVDEPNEADIQKFGGVENVPPGHGGRGKSDGKIHLYPYSKELENADSIEKLIEWYKREIIVHEIFHFYIQPDLYDISDTKNHGDDAWFGHRLTEGIVETYTQKYMKENNLGTSQTGYLEELILVDDVINDLKKQNKSAEEIDDILMNCNQIEIFDNCINGEYIKNKYICKHKVHIEISKLLNKVYQDLGYDKKSIAKYLGSANRQTNFELLYGELINFFESNNLDTNKIEEIFSEYNEKYSNREVSKQK